MGTLRGCARRPTAGPSPGSARRRRWRSSARRRSCRRRRRRRRGTSRCGCPSTGCRPAGGCPGDGAAHARLLVRDAGQVDAGRAVGGLDEAGAVPRVGAGAAGDVGVADLGAGEVHDRGGGARGAWVRLPLSEALEPSSEDDEPPPSEESEEPVEEEEVVESRVRSSLREARVAASAASWRSFSALRRAFSARSASALRSASAFAFLASWAAFLRAACSRLWRLWSRASCWDASAEAATALARLVPTSREPGWAFRWSRSPARHSPARQHRPPRWCRGRHRQLRPGARASRRCGGASGGWVCERCGTWEQPLSGLDGSLQETWVAPQLRSEPVNPLLWRPY